MRVLITGGAGFLGSHLADYFLDQGDEVWIVDDLSGGDEENVPDGAIPLKVSCQDASPLTFRDVDVVYHCAALAHEGLSVFSPSIITESIFGASVAIFSKAISAGVPHIVYCSSMARYGRLATPYEEWMTPQPVDPYGIAKLASERVLASLANVHDFTFSIAVPHNIVGPRQKYDDPFRNVASIMANRMLQDKPPIIYGDGEQMRCFSDVRDCIPPLVALSEETGIFNIGPDEHWVTINHIASLLASIIGYEGEPLYLPSRPLEVKHAYCSSERARKHLNYHTQYELEETLGSIVDWIAEQGPKPFNYYLPIEITEGCPETWRRRLL